MAVAEGKPIPVRNLTSKNDTVSHLDLPHPADFKPSWKPTPGCWHVALWEQAAFWVVPDSRCKGFHVSKLSVINRSAPESKWETMFDGTNGSVRIEMVDWYLKLFGLPWAEKVEWKTFEKPGLERPFGEPESAAYARATNA
jgi:hypothetical protein